jgi:hypothetical protein
VRRLRIWRCKKSAQRVVKRVVDFADLPADSPARVGTSSVALGRVTAYFSHKRCQALFPGKDHSRRGAAFLARHLWPPVFKQTSASAASLAYRKSFRAM